MGHLTNAATILHSAEVKARTALTKYKEQDNSAEEALNTLKSTIDLCQDSLKHSLEEMKTSTKVKVRVINDIIGSVELNGVSEKEHSAFSDPTTHEKLTYEALLMFIRMKRMAISALIKEMQEATRILTAPPAVIEAQAPSRTHSPVPKAVPLTRLKPQPSAAPSIESAQEARPSNFTPALTENTGAAKLAMDEGKVAESVLPDSHVALSLDPSQTLPQDPPKQMSEQELYETALLNLELLLARLQPIESNAAIINSLENLLDKIKELYCKKEDTLCLIHILATTYERITNPARVTYEDYEALGLTLKGKPSPSLQALGIILITLGLAIATLGIVFAPVLVLGATIALGTAAAALGGSVAVAATATTVGVLSAGLVAPGIGLFAHNVRKTDLCGLLHDVNTAERKIEAAAVMG